MAMMQGIRDHAKGWLAWVVVILISIPFALFGINEYFNPDPNVEVASVNGTEITFNQLQRANQRYRADLQSRFGELFDVNRLGEDRLRAESLERLIQDELVVQEAVGHGMRISDAQLAQGISTLPVFQQDGTFSKPAYEQWLRGQGYSSEGFEYEMRRSMLNQQILAGIAGSAVATPRDVGVMKRLRAQTRKYARLLVPAGRFQDVEIGDDAISDYYEKNKDRFVTPERIQLEYLELSRDDIAAGIEIDEQTLRDAYETQVRNYSTPEQRKASHILLQLDSDTSDADVEVAREKLLDFKGQLEEGADFAQLAKENSDDPGTARQGGDLGYFDRGIMDPAFEDAAFLLAEGEVSDPVRSGFGLHLIKVTAIKAGETRSFEDLRETLLKEQQLDRATESFVEQAEQLANLAFEHPESLEVAQETLGLEPKETEFFGRDGLPEDPIARDRKVIEAAFSPDVLEDGNNSAALELDDSRVVVGRVKQHEPSTQRSLEDAREEIVDVLEAEAGREKALGLGKELLARLRSGDDPESVAGEHDDLSWEGPADATRDAGDLDPILSRALFRMPHPADGNPSYDGAVLGTGDFAVLALHEVLDEAPDGTDGDSPDADRNALAQDYGRDDYDTLLKSLRGRAEVEVLQENL